MAVRLMRVTASVSVAVSDALMVTVLDADSLPEPESALVTAMVQASALAPVSEAVVAEL
jgi:hypothetical protein